LLAGILGESRDSTDLEVGEMTKYRLKDEDISPLCKGLAVLGTGGGGSPDWGEAILRKELADGRELIIIDPEDIDDSALIVSGGIMGSVKTFEQMSITRLLEAWDERFELLEATRAMERYLGRSVDYVIPFEVGGLNTPVIMALAARMGTSTVNGDALGRSAPETQMTSFLMHGVPLIPMPLVDRYGNTIIVAEQSKSTFADEMGRWMVTKGGGLGANNHYPMSGAQVKRVAIPKTVTKALEIGRVIEGVVAKGDDPVEAVRDCLEGHELFKGTVVQVSAEDRGGFYITNVDLKGHGLSAGLEARLVIKNETMVLWVDDDLKAVFPDLVCMLDPQTGEGIMSVDIAEGKEMVLVGTPCHARLRQGLNTEMGREAFGGARYGHPEVTYVPIEELNRF